MIAHPGLPQIRALTLLMSGTGNFALGNEHIIQINGCTSSLLRMDLLRSPFHAILECRRAKETPKTDTTSDETVQ